MSGGPCNFVSNAIVNASDKYNGVRCIHFMSHSTKLSREEYRSVINLTVNKRDISHASNSKQINSRKVCYYTKQFFL